jgi:uncharacterized CHY-type Zn-finger protein
MDRQICACPHCFKEFNSHGIETQWDYTYETPYIKCPICNETITYAAIFVMQTIAKNFNTNK